MAPALAVRCLHCESLRVRNADPGQSWNQLGGDYALLRCDDCAGLFTFPSPSPETLSRLYKEGFAYKWYRDHYPAKFLDAVQRMVQYRNLEMLEKRKGLKLLDYGGGVGYFSAAARLFGYDAETRDPMYEQSDDASRKGALADSYDAIACHHVLEHAIDPVVLLRDIYARLRPGGTLIIAVPNGASAGYEKHGVKWTWSQPPLIHLHHITPIGLRALLDRAGFHIKQEHYFDRWDANTLSDVALADLFANLDGKWSRVKLQWLAAQVNSLRRYLALLASDVVIRPKPEARAELLMVAERPEADSTLR